MPFNKAWLMLPTKSHKKPLNNQSLKKARMAVLCERSGAGKTDMSCTHAVRTYRFYKKHAFLQAAGFPYKAMLKTPSN